ncbi:C10 family peptidase [bacterium]|nr:C10 family peptidase [bacterium]
MKDRTIGIKMKSMKYILPIFGFLLLFFFQSGICESLTKDEVKVGIQTWIREVAVDSKPDGTVEILEPHVVAGETLAYIAHIRGGGFCLCGADNSLFPVYYYSPEGTYDPDDIHYQAILHGISQGTKKFRGLEKTRSDELVKYRKRRETLSEYWDQLISRRVIKRDLSKGMWDGPDQMSLDIPWWTNHQFHPFNIFAPTLFNPAANCSLPRCPDGCVAHSMSCIMRYWAWPDSGVGGDTTYYKYRRASDWIEEPLSFNPFGTSYDTTQCRWKQRLRWRASDGGWIGVKGDWDEDDFKCDAKDLCNVNADLIDTTLSTAESLAVRAALDDIWSRMTPRQDTLIADFSGTAYDWDNMPAIIGEIDTPEEINAVSTLTYHTALSVKMGYGRYGSGAYTNKCPEALENHFKYDPDAVNGVYGHCTEPDTCEGAKLMVEEIQWFRPFQYYYGSPFVHAWFYCGYTRNYLPDSMLFRDYYGSWEVFDDAIIEHPMNIMIAPKDMAKFVGADDPGDGSPDNPYQNINEVIAKKASIPDGAQIIFKAGTENTYTDSLLLDIPVLLRGQDVLIKPAP